MKKLSALLICLLMFTSCGVVESFLEENESFFESPDYPVVTYEIENAVDGVYNVTWQNSTGFPDTILNVEVKKGDKVIYKYSCDEKGNESRPEKVVHLFEYDDGNVYYVQNYASLLQNGTVSDYLTKIVYDGKNVPDFMDYDNWVSINIGNYNSEYRQEQLRKTSKFLRENITEQEIADIFDKCGYDDTYILEIYNYSEKD